MVILKKIVIEFSWVIMHYIVDLFNAGSLTVRIN